MDTLLIYAFSVYFLFHLANRSDLLARPRKWVLSTLPAWMVYASSCALCWTFWVGVLISFGFWFVEGHLMLSVLHLMAAPVVNLIVDLLVRDLIRRNEPPVMGSGYTLTCGDQSITTWTTVTPGGSFVYPSAPNGGGGSVSVPSVLSVWAPLVPPPKPMNETKGSYVPSPTQVPPPAPFNPLDHEQTR